MVTITDRLNYDKISKLKSEQNNLISQGKMQKPAMVVGFTQEDRAMFDEGVPMEAVFERVTEHCTV